MDLVHALTLDDFHWIGGVRDHLHVNGGTAWSPREGMVTLRNLLKDLRSTPSPPANQVRAAYTIVSLILILRSASAVSVERLLSVIT